MILPGFARRAYVKAHVEFSEFCQFLRFREYRLA